MSGGRGAPVLTSQGSGKAEIVLDEAQGSGEAEIVSDEVQGLGEAEIVP
jgi:hypothetical protein